MGALKALTELGASFADADVRVLCYHSVRTRDRFAAQMAGLAERGYAVLSMQHFTAWLQGRAPLLRPPAALLTFDGGYPDQLDNAVPVLEALKFPATFFPVSCDLHAEGAMTRRDLVALAAAGHAIGCHSHTHPDLTTLSPGELEEEVVGSKRRLEEALGQPVSAFCYPDGARDSRVASVVRRAGFDVAFTVDLGGVDRGDDPYHLKRVPVLGEPHPGAFFAYLSGTPILSGALLLGFKVRERFLR